MVDLIVGCKTNVPDGDDRFFNVAIVVTSEQVIPTRIDEQKMVDFLQPHVNEIIDEVSFILNAETEQIVWKKDER